MSYTKTTWRNNQAPAINADNLNHMEQGIESAHNQIDVNTSNIESLTTQVQNNATNIASEISARQTTDSSLQSQIDQLVAPTGEAPTPAEIENARIGDDGVIYDTLGNAIRGQFSDVKSDIDDLTKRDAPITGYYYINPDNFEIGGITIGSSGWSYSASTSRVRTKENVTYHLGVGDVIGLRSYDGYRFYLGWRKADDTYGYHGWNTADYTVSVEGDYVILLAENPDATQSSKTNLLKLLSIKSADSVANKVYSLDSDVDGLKSLTSYLNNKKTQLADTDFVNTSSVKVREVYGSNIGQSWFSSAINPSDSIAFYLTKNGNRVQIPAVRGDVVNVKGVNLRGEEHPTFINWGAIQIREMDSDGNYVTSSNKNGDGYGNYDFSYTINNTATVKFEMQFRITASSAYSVSTSFSEQIICDYFEVHIGELVIQATNQEVKNARDGFISLNDRLNYENSILDANVINPYLHSPFHAHLGINEINSIGAPAIIPSQSIWDIEASARLGFKVIEGNVHATATDGKYVVMHGASNDQIGNEIMDTNGDSPYTTKFSEIAYSTLRENYVYRSPFEKYRTPITSLEEFCLACRKYNIIPLLQRPNHNYEGFTDIVKGILGNNWVLYGWSSRSSADFGGAVMTYVGGTTTASALEALCDAVKPPFIVCLGIPNGRYTDAELLELISAVHSKNCLITFDKCYRTPAYGHHLLSLGFDGAASAWDVNEVDGNLMTLNGDIDYSAFTTTASASNYNLEFGEGDTIEIDSASVFLGKGLLDVRFDGAFDISMGRYANFNLESDGSSYERISTYFINEKPVFKLTATEQTTLYGIIYKADKC